MKMTVAKKVSFDAAHFLPKYPGKCANMHGHRWVIEVGVCGEVGSDGMVIDFVILSGLLGTLKNRLDHSLLNDLISLPTAESICLYVREWIGGSLDDEGMEVAHIKVWETEDSYAEWRP